ncbi:MAG: hypothetical protein IJZ75_05420, partial [Clostridia bacterium]|nr:hypothetical protein [Clostridia bacterium]
DETLALATSDVIAFVEAANDFNEIAVTNGYFEATDAAFIRFTAALNAAKGEETLEQKLENLKKAWGEMYIADSLMSPTIEKVSGSNTQSTVYSTADGINNLPAGITADALGSNYAYHKNVFESTGTAENRFMWSKATSGTGVEMSNADLSVYDDLTVSFYVEQVATAGTFSIDLYTQGKTVDVANTTYNITKADEGKWITLHGDDMRVNGFDELISKMAEVNNGSYRLYFFQFGLGSNATKFKGYFGSLLGIKNAVVPDLDGAELVAAAMDLDLTNYKNTAAFVTALDAAKEIFAADVAVDELKTAWEALVIKKTLLPTGLFDGTKFTLKDSSTYEGTDLADKSLLGDKYITHTLTGGSGSDTIDRVTFTFTEENTTLKTGQLKDFSVYVKTTGTNALIPFFMNPLGHRCNAASQFNAAAIGTNRWSQLKMSNLPQQDILWSSTALGAVTDRLVTGVDFDFNNTGDITVGSMTMEFYAVDAKTLALARVNPSAFIIAAKNFYYEALSNDYFAENDEAFNDFVTALDAVKDYEGLFEAAVDSLAEAYGDLTIEEALVPSGLYDGTKFTLMDASTYEGTDLADKSVLGDKYIVHNLAGGTGADAIDRVTFTFARTGAEYTYGQLKDFGVYVKTTGTNALIPFFMNPNGQRVNAASQFNAAAIGTNRWTQLKMSNLPQQDVLWSSTALGAVTDRLITGVDFDFNSTGEVTIGTMFMELKAASDEIIALKDTDVSLFIANALSFADKAERENLFDANDAGYAKFENLLTILKSIEGNEELLTIAELQAAWLSLSDNSTFPETDTTNWDIADWVYAANRVDISGLTNTEAFVEALEKATALRDALGMEFSCNTSTYANSDDAKLHIQGLGENIISNLVPTVYYFDGTDRVEVTDVQYANFLDSDFETVTSVATENGGNGAYVEFIYRYDGMADIIDFLVGSSVNEPLGKYRIYVADTIDKLADANSIVVSFDNTAAEQVQIFNFDGKPDVSGTYIALRVYTDGNSVNIGEFGVYGQYLKYGIQTGSFTDEQMAALGESLLANEDTVAYIKGATGAKTKWAQANMGYNVENLTDCKNDTVIGVGGKGAVVKTAGEETTFHIFFDLKETYYIKQLLINHFRQPHLQTGKYEIYASTDYATLFKSSSKVLSYNNMVDGPNGTTETQLFTAMGDGVIARYVSFCIKVPINDYDKSLSWYPSLCYPRLNDLAVYGERYYKPLKEVNFLGHMPVDVYRADAGGNKSTITEDEYDGLDYLNAADGIYEVATPIAQNGKNIDFVFNLCANKSINSVKLSTLTENVRGLKVYAAEDLDSVWSNEALVVDYYNINADSKEISKTFGETPIYARYIRFSITDTVSGTFDPTEFEVIGWNNQEFIYMNLAEERSENSSIWLEDKDTYDFAITSSKVGKYNTPWLDEDFYDFMYAFDGDPASVADLYSGSRGNADGTGRVTLNILVDLTSLNAVDNINFKSGGTKDYWPSEINFYLGEDDLSLFGKDAEPIKEFTSKTTDEDGNYSYTFLPEIAQYVRIEIVEGTQRYFEHINKIGAVISEIQVNGLEIVGFTASEGVAASVTDEETGIRADVVAIRDNDVFSKVQDILVIKRAATAEEKAAVKAQGVAFASDVYDIYLLDSGGNLISDVEGREIRICLPKSLFNGEGDPYVLSSSYGEFNMVDFVVEDDYYIATVAEPFGMVFAFCEFITDDEEAEEDDDTADDMDNTLEGEDESETEDDESEEDEYKTIIKKIRRPKKSSDISDYLWIIIVIVAVVIVAAGITLFIILAKKKKKQEEEA